ncbi:MULTISPECIES: Tn3 family transposase [spotted fever group]|uniref:Tn3 family transposase n=1 Tax=spotted fever group TaxID=114277 RepID=UPI0012694373
MLTNAIIYYNSVILSGVLDKYENLANNKKFLTILKKISPVAWHHHIHFLGQYTFYNKGNSINIGEIMKNIELTY